MPAVSNAASKLSGLGTNLTTALGNGVSNAGSSAVSGLTSGSLTGSVGNAGSGSDADFGSEMASFAQQGAQALKNQVAMNNLQLQMNQAQQIASQAAKTTQGGIDKMDVK